MRAIAWERKVERQQRRVDYDQALKRLLTRAHDGFLSLIAPDVRWRAELSSALPATGREADLVWEVAADDGSTGLLHVELQTAVEPDIGERMAEYGVMLWRHYHVPIRSVVVFLRESARTPVPPYVVRWGQREIFRYDFEVVRLWEIPQERVLEREDVALWPLASLMAGVTAETTLRVAERIARARVTRDLRRELASLLALLASRRLAPDVLHEVMRSNPMLEELLRESPLAELLKQEGRQEGQLAGERVMVREALEGRFGTVPDDVLDALQQADEATMRDVIRHLATETVSQVRERLGLG